MTDKTVAGASPHGDCACGCGVAILVPGVCYAWVNEKQAVATAECLKRYEKKHPSLIAPEQQPATA